MLDPDGYDQVDHVDESDNMPGAAYADSDEDHPEMLDEPSADHDRDPVDYGNQDHHDYDGNQD
jgi:hypothetical protein